MSRGARRATSPIALTRSRRLPIVGVLLSMLIASGLLSACGDDATGSGEVVLYTSMPDAVVMRLQGVVEQRFPDLDGNYWLAAGDGITLRVVRGRTADIQQRIANELDDDGIQADVIWLAEPSPYRTFADLGLLAPYQPPAGAPIPSNYVDADGFYVAGRIISMVLAWNTAGLPDGLDDWPDLLEVTPSAFPAPESGAARATIKALIDMYGREYFTSLATGGATAVPSNGAARDGVAGGTFNAVAVLDYMARQAKKAGSPVDFIYPASGTAVIPSPIAITRDANNPTGAETLVDFILSAPGQEIMVQIGDFYPVRTDVDPPAGAPPLDTLAQLDIDFAALSSEIDGISELWAELFGASQ